MLHCRFTSLRVVVLLAFVIALTQSGCRENTLINSRVVPSNNTIGVYDTSLPCITHTYSDDTVITSVNIGGLPIYQAVGAIVDPFFGNITGSTFFQVVPNSFNSSLYDGATIDSVVLVLPYSGFGYGDTVNAQPQSYQAFYISDNDSLSYTTNYFPFSMKSLDATPLCDPTTVDLHHLSDTFSVGGIYYSRGLRIRLNKDAFWNKLTPAQAVLTTSSSPATDFINVFKGICVKVSNPLQYNIALPYFRLDGSTLYDMAGVLVYYHNSTTDTLVENYSFNTSYCAHFNHFDRNYTSFPVNGLYTSTAANDSLVGLQNQPGAAIDVIIPGIKSLPAGIINKAELQFTLLPNYTSTAFAGPEKIYPLGIANGVYPVGVSASLTYNIADRYPLTSLTPLGVMDGYVHTSTRNGQTVYTYTIDMPREVMTAIAAKTDTLHLHINGTQDYYGAFHMVAAGGSNADLASRPKFFVVYSKLNK